MKPRPTVAVIALFVAFVAVVVGTVPVVLHQMGTFWSPIETSWLRDTVLCGVGVVIFGIVFLTGRGWARIAVGLLFLLDAALPWLLYDPRYPGAIVIAPSTDVMVPALGIVMVALAFTPPVNAWAHEMSRYR
jgi:hypothetical protein